MKRSIVLGLVLIAAPCWAADAGAGKKVYDAKCASCHGKEAKGNPAMEKMFKSAPGATNLVDEETGKKAEADLAAVTEKGQGKMPAFAGKLKPEEIADAVAYVKSLGAAAPAAAGGKEPAGGQAPPEAPEAALFKKSCASCHGKDGKGNPAMAKMFKVDNAALDLADKATLEKKDEELAKVLSAGAGKMPAYEKKLKPEELAALVSYVRSLAPKAEEPKK